MPDDDIVKNIQIAENILNTIKERSENCDPNIVYSLSELQTTTDKLFKKYGDITKDRSLQHKFSMIIADSETYRGKFTYNCDCRSKSR